MWVKYRFLVVVYLVTTRLKLSTVLLRAGVERLLIGSESRTALAVTMLVARSFSFSPSLPLHKAIDFKQAFDT